MPYWRLYYHATWACSQRLPIITSSLEPALHKYIAGKGLSLGAIVHAVGGLDNHVHLVFSLPPKYAISDFIGRLKGAASHWVTHILKHPDYFNWQRGYGVVSFGDRNMRAVIRYVHNQKTHHQQETIRDEMEKWSEEDDGVGVGPAPNPPDDKPSGYHV